MTLDLKGAFVPDRPMVQQVTLTITFTPGQGIAVSGPLKDAMLCYGLLGCARDIVAKAAADVGEQMTPLAVPTQGLVL